MTPEKRTELERLEAANEFYGKVAVGLVTALGGLGLVISFLGSPTESQPQIEEAPTPPNTVPAMVDNDSEEPRFTNTSVDHQPQRLPEAPQSIQQ